MDKRIRRNEICAIGLPRCDFVFSSTRSCFIGYGFNESKLEMSILRNLLTVRGIETVEASGNLSPGQNAFCTKICSKIIVSQFCIILLNNDVREGKEIPNANVNMEYGLMLGFNKYVVPFQRESQTLPFNVAGLDTVKYTNENFEERSAKALDKALADTTQESTPTINVDQVLEAFLLSKRLLVVPIYSEGDKNLFEIGRPLGFNMLMTFDGMKYVYFGNFTALRPEAVLWRIRTFEEIMQERIGSIPTRVKLGLPNINPQTGALLQIFLEQTQLMLLVTSTEEKVAIQEAIAVKPTKWPVEVYAIEDITDALKNIG